ncbi:MAG TPA: glycosyltransferase, partial [candidate division Zixibacteria bacterium]|nr:glycosyltransferase [candidate division Zixibacteria bacterium]
PDRDSPIRRGRRAVARRVLLTVGGGEDGMAIVETYLAMLRLHRRDVDWTTTILPGPLLAEDQMTAIQQHCTGLPVRVHQFVADITPLVRKADLVVSMGGYNAVSEILGNGRRALIIPRAEPRLEQHIRAERLAEMGLIGILPMAALSPDRLFASVATILENSSQPLVRARIDRRLPLNGTAVLSEFMEEIIGKRWGVTRAEAGDEK